MLKVLETTKYVIENSEFVGINKEKIKELAKEWKQEKIKIPTWDYSYHFFDSSWRTCEYLFILDSLNFCFWAKNPENKWSRFFLPEKNRGSSILSLTKSGQMKHERGRYLDGYFALAFIFKKAIEEGLVKLDPSFILKMNYSDFRKIFQGKGELPLLRKRFEILKENYRILDRKYNGKFVNLIDKCDNDAVKLVSGVIRNFPSFKDEAVYKGKKVYFYKRAQILAGDLHASFRGRKWGRLKNLDKLTAFADYKIPQILRGYEILEYKDSLAKKVDNRKLISQSSKEEIEIRASQIWAIEFIKNELKKLGVNLRSIEIDCILWHKAQKDNLKLKPYHLTKTIYY